MAIAVQGLLVVALLIAGAQGEQGPLHALATLDHMLHCSYDHAAGVFLGEGLWQTANTLELSAMVYKHTNATELLDMVQHSFNKTFTFMDKCYDDWQWWLHAWVRAYEADPSHNIAYLQRAATIFDKVSTMWSDDVCGGGLIWCPQTTYKNAITNELFLVSSMYLHPYASLVGKPADFYLNWAKREWAWFEKSGMINSEFLINDGLTDACVNNNQTTWTYNQGVLLTGLGLLHDATKNDTLIAIGSSLLSASMTALSSNGILHEPCESNGCGRDGGLFKGIYMRHVRYFSAYVDPALRARIDDFTATNAASIFTNDVCNNTLYGVVWSGPCKDPADATMSAAADAFFAAGDTHPTPSLGNLLGLGQCISRTGEKMPACRANSNLSFFDCESAALKQVWGAVAYDVEQLCLYQSICRVRTLAGSDACPDNWTYEADGNATSVDGADGSTMTSCFLV